MSYTSKFVVNLFEGPNDSLTKGKVYLVERVSGGSFLITNDLGYLEWYYQGRFVPYQEKGDELYV